MKTTKEITELKKETNRLVVEKVHLFSCRGKMEEAITDSCQYIHESIAELDAVAKAKRLREVIAQLQQDNSILNALVYLDTPPK